MKVGRLLGALVGLSLLLAGCGGGVLFTGVLDFTATVLVGAAPLQVQFTAQYEGDIRSFLWDFGDGTTSTEENPVHTYGAAGIYTVSLTVDPYWGVAPATVTKADYIKVASPGGYVPPPPTGVGSAADINDAIDNAGPGGLVIVGAGTYAGDVTVDQDGLRIMAASRPKIDGDLIVDADDVTVDGFEVTGVLETTAFTSFANLTLIDTLIYGEVFNTTLTCDDVVNEGESIQTSINGAAGGETICVAPGTYDGFKADSKAGLVVFGISDPVVSGAKVNVPGLTTGSCPAGMEALIAVDNSADVTIQGLVVDASGYLPNCFFGIIYYQSSGTIKDNAIRNIEGTGGQARGAIRAQAGTSIAVLDNTITEFDKVGILTRNMDSVQIERNSVSTTFHGTAPNGIIVDSYHGTVGTIKDNAIEGADYDQFDPGEYETEWSGSGILIMEAGDNLEISGNQIQNSDVGIDIESDSSTITGNDIHDNIYGIVLWNANPLINFNNIHGSASYGVYRTAAGDLSGTANAENNWWGSPTGPTHPSNPGGTGDAVSDNVNFDPWATAPF